MFNCRLCSLASWWRAGPHFLLAKNPHHLETFWCKRMSRKKATCKLYMHMIAKGYIHTDMIYTDQDTYYLGVVPLRVTQARIIPFLQEETPLISDYTPEKRTKNPLKSGCFKTEMRKDRLPRFFRSQLRASFAGG